MDRSVGDDGLRVPQAGKPSVSPSEGNYFRLATKFDFDLFRLNRHESNIANPFADA